MYQRLEYGYSTGGWVGGSVGGWGVWVLGGWLAGGGVWCGGWRGWNQNYRTQCLVTTTTAGARSKFWSPEDQEAPTLLFRGSRSLIIANSSKWLFAKTDMVRPLS